MREKWMDRYLSVVYRKDYEGLSALLADGFDVNSRDADGRTGLMHAVLSGDADTKMVRFLVEAGADVNIHDGEQAWTALHFAARDNKFDIVELLIGVGAEVDAVDCFGNTPLWRAVMSCKGGPSVAALLLANGADPARQNNTGVSPPDIAQTMGNADLEILLGNQR